MNAQFLPSMCTSQGYLRVADNKTDVVEMVVELMGTDHAGAVALVDKWYSDRVDVTAMLIALAKATDPEEAAA